MSLPASFQPLGPQLTPPPPAGLGGTFTPEQRLELLEYWRSITKRKWIILGLALVVGLVAALVAMTLTPVYTASATVLVEASKAKILSVEDVYSVNPQREHYQTQVELLKSREVADRTVRAMKLWEHPLFDARMATPTLRVRAMELVGASASKAPLTEDQMIGAAVARLMASTSVQPVRLSQLVKVNIESEDGALAAKIANTLAAEYIDSDRDARFKITQGVSTFLQERLTSLREKLTESERALQKYRETKGIVSLGGSAQTMAGQQVGGTNERLLQARAKRLELEGLYQQVRSITNGDYSGLPWVLRDQAVAEARRVHQEAKRKLTEALETLGTAHPRARQLEAEQAQAQATLAQLSRNVANTVVREFEAARSTEISLERALGQVKGEVQTVNREEFQLAVLEREVATNRQLYDMFMSRAKETNLSSEVQAPVARVIDPAVPGTSPIKPNRRQIVLVALLLALLAGALGAMLLDRLDNTVKGGEDAELRLKQPLVAAIPEVQGLDGPRIARLVLDDPHSHFAEAVRTARTGILLSNLDSPRKTVLITSSLPGEGKTTIAINLALAHAQTKKTLLIDGDMRRSHVSRALSLPPGRPGLSNLVAGTAPAHACLHGVPDSALTVLPVGDLPPNPLELLLSQRFKEAFQELQQHFDVVIIDSPPVELVSDALVLAPLAQSTVYVVKAMSTPAPVVRKSLLRLQRANAHILGVVVNQLDFRHARLYYGEYGAGKYGYGNYGGYGYGAQGGGTLTYGAKALKDSQKKVA